PKSHQRSQIKFGAPSATKPPSFCLASTTHNCQPELKAALSRAAFLVRASQNPRPTPHEARHAHTRSESSAKYLHPLDAQSSRTLLDRTRDRREYIIGVRADQSDRAHDNDKGLIGSLGESSLAEPASAVRYDVVTYLRCVISRSHSIRPLR